MNRIYQLSRAIRPSKQMVVSPKELGRWFCCVVEDIPAYFFLKRYYGRSLAAERKRRCPGCDGRWLLDPPWHRVYEFRCDRCRLVSQVGDDVR